MTLRFVVFFCLFSHISSLFGAPPPGPADGSSTAAPQEQITLAVGHTALPRSAFPIRRIPPTPTYEPDKTPSQVYQRAVLLHTQLKTLQFWVNQTPAWLAPQQES